MICYVVLQKCCHKNIRVGSFYFKFDKINITIVVYGLLIIQDIIVPYETGLFGDNYMCDKA